MKKFSAAFLTIAFILWIMPLGVFIKPYQEQFACDGQRAMCMCHALIVKSADKAMEGVMVLKEAAATGTTGPSGGGANDFISARPAVTLGLPVVYFFDSPYLCYKNPFLAALDHVPRITLF